MPQPDAIIACARGWLGTPYHHQGSVRGAGCDCLGLIRGVWRALYGPEPETLPPYSRDWGNATGSETLLSAACRHLVPLASVDEARSGDVLVFRMRDHGVAKHAGIVSAAPLARPALKNETHTPCHGRARPGHPRLADVALPPVDARVDSGHDGSGWHMIHAQEGLGVVEVSLGRWWRRRAVAAFRFPS